MNSDRQNIVEAINAFGQAAKSIAMQRFSIKDKIFQGQDLLAALGIGGCFTGVETAKENCCPYTQPSEP